MSFLAFQETIQAGIAGQKPGSEPAAGKPADLEGNGEIHGKTQNIERQRRRRGKQMPGGNL